MFVLPILLKYGFMSGVIAVIKTSDKPVRVIFEPPFVELITVVRATVFVLVVYVPVPVSE